jgi:hypothetical protein
MNERLPQRSVRVCPSCNAAVNEGSLSCSSCGGLLVVEGVLSRLRFEAWRLMKSLSERMRDPAALIWVLVLIPILIVPPAVGVLLALRGKARGPDPVFADSTSRTFAIIVGVCNVVLSILFWRWLGSVALGLGFSLGALFRFLGINPPGVSGSGSI